MKTHLKIIVKRNIYDSDSDSIAMPYRELFGINEMVASLFTYSGDSDGAAVRADSDGEGSMAGPSGESTRCSVCSLSPA